MENITELKNSADNKLAKIAEFRKELVRIQSEAEAKIAEIRDAYAPSVHAYEEEIAETEKELIGLMKKNTAQLFDDVDQVELTHGILLYGKEPKVTIPKDALSRIEVLGWEDGLKRSVTIDREAISIWPVERLAVIGATLKEKKTYTYELKEAGRRDGADAEQAF
jgi:phage host-nuclease inhibitor protein Gam